MPRPVSNPPNPWAGPHTEWLEEPPAARLEVYEEEAKSALTANDSPDLPFRWGLNPYRGCQHACAYCYARPTHTWLGFGAGTDFETKLVVRRNLAEVLRRELARGKARGDWVALSGVTDPYQSLEAAYGVTRACLEALLDFRVGVGVITKGALVRRDADLLARIGEAASAGVYLSIPFADPATARALEPAAPSPAKRFEALRALTDAGLTTGIAISPVIPGVNDSQLPELLERARDAGATRAGFSLLRLPKEARTVFEERVREALPLRADKVLSLVRQMREGQGHREFDFGQRMRGSDARWDLVEQTFRLHARRLGLSVEAEVGAAEGLRRDRTGGSGEQQGELFG